MRYGYDYASIGGDEGDDISFFPAKELTTHSFDLDDADSDKMQKIIARRKEIERVKKELYQEEQSLMEEGILIFQPYEAIRRQEEHEERERKEKEARQKKEQEKEANVAVKQAINEWQREHKQRFPGFGC